MFGSIIILSLVTMNALNAQYICPPSTQCNVDCSAADVNCSTIIDGTRATSLHVWCNSANGCSFTDILLPNATSQNSSITCSIPFACSNTAIHYFGDATSSPSNNHIQLICTDDDACYNTSIIADNAGTFKLNCDEAKCQNLNISVVNASHVHLRCQSGLDFNSTDYGGCYGSNNSFFVNAEHASSVNITCEGYRGCHNIFVNAERADSLSVYATPLGLYDGEYIATNVRTSFEITCIGSVSNPGCSQTPQFWLPSNFSKFTVNCYGTGCADIQFTTTSDGFLDISDANINFNGCHQCRGLPTGYRTKYNSHCLSIRTNCTTTYGEYELLFPPKYVWELDTWYCGDPYGQIHGNVSVCYCYSLAQAFKDAYIEDPTDSLCILPHDNKTIECTQGSSCEIDCGTDDCGGRTIEASQSNALRVICNGQDSCKGTLIYAPISPLSTATIICNGTGACADGGYRSKEFFILSARDSYDVTVIVSPKGVEDGVIDAKNIQHSFTLTCIGNGADPCITDDLVISVPNNLSKFTLNCYGTGCAEWGGIKLYTHSGFQEMTPNIYWNGCAQCPDLEHCLDGIQLYCYDDDGHDNDLMYGSSWTNDVRCLWGDRCGCSQLASTFADSYMDNSADPYCIAPPEHVQILCGDPMTCAVNCSAQDCVGKIIDGTHLSSLNVYCETVNSCSDTIIYATVGKSTSTTIVCDAAGTYVSSPSGVYRGHLSFDLSGCNGDFKVMAQRAYDLTVTGMPHGIVRNGVRGWPIIYAQSIQNSFVLNCIGNGVNHEWHNTSYYAEKYSWSSNKHYGCNGLVVFPPSLDADLYKFKLNCYGTGCGDIYFRKRSGLANMPHDSINFNGCSQCNDDVASNCLGSIQIYCRDTLDDWTHSSFGKTEGFNCGSPLSCGCNALASVFKSGYSDDPSDPNCMSSQSKKDMVELAIIFGITIPVLVCFATIAVLRCTRKRNVDVAAASGGDTDDVEVAEMDPLNVNHNE
eukprot:53463_1